MTQANNETGTTFSIYCTVGGVKYDTIDVQSSLPISPQDWELLKTTIPTLFAKFDAKFQAEMEAMRPPSTTQGEANVAADFTSVNASEVAEEELGQEPTA
jgi:hypothetical protein